MSNSKLIELSYYDPSAQVRLSAYEGEPGAGFGAPPSGFTPNFGEENGELPF